MRLLQLILASVLLPAMLLGQVPFNLTPSWISTDVSNYSTGAAWADINRDGWLDLVVANGNDMARQRVVVYYNNGNGTLPTTPNWQSGDIDYHGHLSVGDVDGDGFPDVAVSVYIGAAGFSQKGRIKLYRNVNGTLTSTPAWISRDSMYSFSCAFGDADGDGDLDLAVAGGESYYNRSEKNRVYFNRNGILDSLPGWMSGPSGFSYDVTWADFDNDGDLDLVFANERGPNHIYRNHGDSLGTVPVWASTDASQYANSLFVGDVNGDGWLDLAISDNNQLGGTGKFKIYLNNNGAMASTPFWSSAFSGYGSGINLADIDNDGDRDLITGGWWQPCRIYQNNGGTFSTAPQWTSTSTSVVEAIVFGDCDNDALDTSVVQFAGNGSRKLFYLPRSPVQRLDYVVLAGGGPGDAPMDTLPRSAYCFDLENGWVSLASAPGPLTTVRIGVAVSRDLDFAVSNWDNNKGNYVFVNQLNPVSVTDPFSVPEEFALHQNFPNPFNPMTTIRFTIPSSVKGSNVSLTVSDILGRVVSLCLDGEMEPGSHEVMFDGSDLPSGVYFYRLTWGERTATRKLVLVK